MLIFLVSENKNTFNLQKEARNGMEEAGRIGI